MQRSSRFQKRLLLALCLAPALLVGLSPWLSARWARGDARPSRGYAACAPALRWTPGARQLYRLESLSVARMQLRGSGSSAPMEARLAGLLELAVEEVDEAGARVRFRLEPATYSAPGMPDRAGEIGLSTPFGVAFRADGLPYGFDFPADLDAEARTVLEQLVRTFQVVVTPGSRGGWSTREENATGQYRADYRAAADGTLVKEKTAFEAVSTQATGLLGALDVRILRSRALVRLDPASSWVEEVRVEEETQLHLPLRQGGGASILEATLAATLVRTTALPAVPGSSEVSEASLVRRSVAEPIRAALPSSEPPPVTPEVAARFEELMDELERTDGASTQSVHGIRDLVATYPEAAAWVSAALLDAELGEAPAAALVNALQLAGTPPAQGALGSILGDARFGRANRLRAAIALGGLERATAIAQEALWSATTVRDTEQAEELADTALLALGALAPSAGASADEPGTALELRLSARLAEAGDPDETGILLGALGNTRDPTLAATVAPYLEDESAYVRSSAADALGNLQAPWVEEALTARLGREDNAHVRTALAGALARLPEPTRASLALVQELVLTETSDSAGLEMTRFLARNLDSFPAARPTLEELIRGARSRSVRSCAAEALLRR